jgi:hypothetical protein
MVPDRSYCTFSLLLSAIDEAVRTARVHYSGDSSPFSSASETCDGFSEGVGGKGNVGDGHGRFFGSFPPHAVKVEQNAAISKCDFQSFPVRPMSLVNFDWRFKRAISSGVMSVM